MTFPYGNDYPEPDESGAELLRHVRNGEWLDEQMFPALTYAVPGLLPEGSSLLVGPPKAGKSWLVLGWALAVAAGGYALGRIQVPRRPVLYLALEDGHRRLQDRCRTLLDSNPIPAGFEYLISVRSGEVFATINAWLKTHPADPAALVILDTLGKVMPPSAAGESSYQRDYRVGSSLKRLCDDHPGVSMLVNHHDRKAAADDFVDSVSGTHGLAGAADTIITLTRQRHETTGLLKVTGRDVVEGEYAITLDGAGTWLIDGANLAASSQQATARRATANLGDRSVDVLGLVYQSPKGISRADVSAKLGISADQASAYLSRLLHSGRVARPSRGLYTPVGSVGSVGTEDVDGPAEPTEQTLPTPLQGPPAGVFPMRWIGNGQPA